MSKRPYRAIDVNKVNFEKLTTVADSKKLVVGIDVAKTRFFAAVMNEGREVLLTIRWSHPTQASDFTFFLRTLGSIASELDVVMEPTGVYGDAVRYGAISEGFDVYRVSPKRSHDAKEVYDGVPSLHDAKSAAIVAWLHLGGASELWPIKPDEERDLVAALRVLELYDKQFQQNRNRLEALLSRHWPEVTRLLDLSSATLLELLIAYGGPEAVAANPEAATALMKRVGGHFLDPEKVQAVISSSQTTAGMPMIPSEVDWVKAIAAETRRNQRNALTARHDVEVLSSDSESTKLMAPLVGKTTAAVLVVGAGDPKNYDSPQAYQKSIGLNLKEKSSGDNTKYRVLRITKRGPAIVRQSLWLAALRLIQTQPIVAAWYKKKVQRDGGIKSKAIVAIMRKLVMALWHVARGSQFDASKLFDVTRLNIDRPLTTAKGGCK